MAIFPGCNWKCARFYEWLLYDIGNISFHCIGHCI